MQEKTDTQIDEDVTDFDSKDLLSLVHIPGVGPSHSSRRPRSALARRSPEEIARLEEEKLKFIESDPIYTSIGKIEEFETTLQRIKLEIAREAASLHYQRIETEKKGKDTSHVSAKRIDALERIAKLELKLRQADKDSISLSGEKIQKIFLLWVETMREIASEVLRPEEMDLFFNRFATAMEGWEEKAQNVLR